MGSVETTPGFSGGTMALITGMYDKLVGSISKVKLQFIKPLFTGDFSKFKEIFLEEIDLKFFIPLGIGMAIALVTFSKVISYLIEFYPVYTFAFFLGLIISSAYLLYTHMQKQSHISTIISIIISILAFIGAFIFVGLNPIAGNHSLIVIFFSAMISICAFILPGIAGSLVLMFLGQYYYMLDALHSFKIVDIIVFMIGALIGILSFSKLLNYLLEHYKNFTMAFLIGLMAGTLREPCTNIINGLSSAQSFILPPYILCIIFAVIGLLVIPILEKKFNYVE
ncbi:MAG: DUF368 domain-containing protein [Methanobrevibacter sp.]|nr:DUF368 domain-containing protein [Candidatus Methanoflexus mossambicus]